MAILNAPSLLSVAYSGDAPLAPMHCTMTLAAAAVGDKVRLGKLFAKSKIHEVKLINAALGAGSTLSVGYEYTEGQAGGGAAALIPAGSTASAKCARSEAAPELLDNDAYLTATVGGAAATGKIDVLVFYEFVGS